MGKSTKVECVCQQCGVSFWRCKSQVARGTVKFCSKSCKCRSQHVICHLCGVSFVVNNYRKENGNPKFCSNGCRRLHRKNLTCQRCGKVFYRRPANMRGKGIFCSIDCYFPNRKKDNCTCPRCGKAFHMPQCRIDKGFDGYCCKRCRHPFWDWSLEDRFFATPTKKMPNGCILWEGSSNGKYGRIPIVFGKNKMVGAHRLSYELMVGPLGPGMEACHNCPGGDTPLCVNPVHLFAGSSAENTADCIAKGRNARGERSGCAKFTDNQVHSIRLRNHLGESYIYLAYQFGVKESTIKDICLYKTWKHLITSLPSLSTLP